MKYIVELHDSAGDLVAILQNATNPSYTENINQPNELSFSIPSNDSKEASITLANEIWLRNYDTGAVVKRFRLSTTKDVRS